MFYVVKNANCFIIKMADASEEQPPIPEEEEQAQAAEDDENEDEDEEEAEKPVDSNAMPSGLIDRVEATAEMLKEFEAKDLYSRPYES